MQAISPNLGDYTQWERWRAPTRKESLPGGIAQRRQPAEQLQWQSPEFRGQTQELALEVSGRLILRFGRRSGGVGGRPHRRRVGGTRVRLSKPIHSRER